MFKHLRLFYLLIGGLFAFSSGRLSGQAMDLLTVRILPEASIPLLGSEDLFKVGGGASLALDLDLLSNINPSVEVGYNIFPTLAQEDLGTTTVGAGALLHMYPSSRLVFGIGGIGGLYQAEYSGETTSDFFGKARVELSYRLSPSFNITATATYTHLLGPGSPLYQGAGIGISGSISLSGLRGGTNVNVSDVILDPIFPIFYSHYDKNQLGSLKIKNNESGSIRDVKVYFYIKQYMDQPKLCTSFPIIRQGASEEVPVYALLTDQVLKLTESAKSSAEIIIEYNFLNSPREARISETLRINHRNALTWDDDRKAAAFVSAKDPAVLRYSKYTAGLIREAGQSEINQNLRFAMGLFEGLSLYGINYVIDPTTPYKELSLNTNALDFLQFPNQTLTYKGGDCDDLSILFSSILESVGIKTAFITIPGHIYMAFSLDISEDEARSTFSNPNDLIYRENETWLPVEITAVNDGFLRAWQIGAKEWYDNINDGLAVLLPIHDAWNDFEPVGIPGEDTRIVLPAPEQILDTYNVALVKFITREIQPKVELLKSEITSSGNKPKQINRLGVLYARYGLLDQAKVEFEKAGRQAYSPALTNLGNVSFLQKNYTDAITYFERALSYKVDNKIALIGLARAQFELENYSETNIAYAKVKKADPQLAGKYSYLVSQTDGITRASNSSERNGQASWDDE